ncbi:hypothetical protein NliqN6_1734 [Naganishia liquefaciens]|uniref:DNA damage-binding protein CMR1 n=1 Tax=Naganishia liquefaciens TaxID=104408 RepID=A0A8H3YEK0_9TREE|nr:hypothetical protein NliqN6_1734 [Naganishia liquefaciens]
MAEENEYEKERQRVIAENAALLAQLGLDHFAASSPAPRSRGSSTANGDKPTASKRKAPQTRTSKRSKLSEADDAASATSSVSTRRSTRLMGLKADSEEGLAHLAERAEREKKEFEERRHAERRVRKAVMTVDELVTEEEWNADNERTGEELTSFLAMVASRPHPKPISSLQESDPDPYPTQDVAKEADMLLWNAYQPSTFLRTGKPNTERIYSMTIHPDPERVLVFSGDKRGIVGVWDANARDEEADEVEGPGVKREVEDDDKAAIVRDWRSGSGKVWRMQVHQRSAISCLKMDPMKGDTLFSSAYDCSIRTISLLTGVSSAIYALPDPDALINHFDISPSGKEIWAVDSLGGLNHIDIREDAKQWGRRRWVISGQNTNTKIGGVGINPKNPALICTASNDRTMRIWDTRHLHPIPSEPFPTATGTSDHDSSIYPTNVSDWNEHVCPAMQTKKHAGLLRTESPHDKSCSAAYWDSAGRRILTTCYDDRIRVFDAKPNLFKQDAPMQQPFGPALKIRHNCQTGRYVTIFKAQWSQNTDLPPHFTIGNMKKRVSVYSGLTGALVADLAHPSLTAVPAVTATHPNIPGVVVGANASGKCHLWGRLYER